MRDFMLRQQYLIDSVMDCASKQRSTGGERRSNPAAAAAVDARKVIGAARHHTKRMKMKKREPLQNSIGRQKFVEADKHLNFVEPNISFSYSSQRKTKRG